MLWPPGPVYYQTGASLIWSCFFFFFATSYFRVIRFLQLVRWPIILNFSLVLFIYFCRVNSLCHLIFFFFIFFTSTIPTSQEQGFFLRILLWRARKSIVLAMNEFLCFLLFFKLIFATVWLFISHPTTIQPVYCSIFLFNFYKCVLCGFMSGRVSILFWNDFTSCGLPLLPNVWLSMEQFLQDNLLVACVCMILLSIPARVCSINYSLQF